MITIPDFRALCAELLDELQYQTSYETNAELQDRARAALATPPPEPPTDDEIEEAAKLIHASMRFAVFGEHCTSDWVERGNSLMQDEARRTARALLERWGHG
jgi:hypothetical protein